MIWGRWDLVLLICSHVSDRYCSQAVSPWLWVVPDIIVTGLHPSRIGGGQSHETPATWQRMPEQMTEMTVVVGHLETALPQVRKQPSLQLKKIPWTCQVRSFGRGANLHGDLFACQELARLKLKFASIFHGIQNSIPWYHMISAQDGLGLLIFDAATSYAAQLPRLHPFNDLTPFIVT